MRPRGAAPAPIRHPIGEAPYPGVGAEGQRGRAGSPERTALPEGWLDSREIGEGVGDMMRGAETENDGG